MPTIRPDRSSARLALCLLAAMLLGLPSTSLAQEQGDEINRIVLRVNEQIYTLHEYEQRKAERISRIIANDRIDNNTRQELLADAGKQVLKTVFDEMLIRSRADQMAVVVDDNQVDAAMRDMRDAQGIRSDAEMMQALAIAGLTLEGVRDNLREELRMQTVMGREVHGKIEVSEESVRLYYRSHTEDFRIPEERNLREIIVLDSSGLDEGARAGIADEIFRALDGGLTFEEAITPYRDQDLTTDVTELGWLTENDLSDGLRAGAFALEKDAYSKPIDARGGLHILQLLDVREGGVRPFTEVATEIERLERGRLFRRELRNYMNELTEQAFVQENLPPEAVGYRSLAPPGEEDEPDALDLFRAPLDPPQQDDTESGR